MRLLFVLCSHGNSLIDGFQNIGLDEFPLTQHSDGCAITVEKSTVLSQLLELDLGHGHQRVHLVFGALEVLNAERVDGHHLDAGLVANLQNLGASEHAIAGIGACR